MTPQNEGPGSSENTLPNVTDRVSETVQSTMSQARDAVGQVTDAIKNTDPKEALETAKDYAGRGGTAVYGTVSEHPLVSATLASLLAYLLFRQSTSDPAEYYADKARQYGRRVRDMAPDVDWDEVRNRGEKYSKNAVRAFERPSSSHPLLWLVGVGLVAWLATAGVAEGNRDKSQKR